MSISRSPLYLPSGGDTVSRQSPVSHLSSKAVVNIHHFWLPTSTLRVRDRPLLSSSPVIDRRVLPFAVIMAEDSWNHPSVTPVARRSPPPRIPLTYLGWVSTQISMVLLYSISPAENLQVMLPPLATVLTILCALLFLTTKPPFIYPCLSACGHHGNYYLDYTRRVGMAF